ncbi:hypothetical protein DSAG12_04310 [Promethearchaeum syntrophicum]|uniref:Uncharacterized protein n=1 Tax=Promethearchaeum syntrophicum TaxID=2594042 RepID=A0AC61ZU14_9ARCH|nr:hypothetical protein [Candidatus Prometheoarchaeum syntrophicum]
MRNRNVFKSILWSFYAFLIVIALYIIILFLIHHTISFEDNPVPLILFIIGSFAWIPAYFLMNLGYEQWYKKYKDKIGTT